MSPLSRPRTLAVVSAFLLATGCGGRQDTAPTTPSIPSTPTGPAGAVGHIRVVGPGANTVIADRDQPVKITVVLVDFSAPTDYTLEVSASSFFTPMTATVRVQLTPQEPTSIPLPTLNPDSWYIWRIRPTRVEEGTFASGSTFRIGPKG